MSEIKYVDKEGLKKFAEKIKSYVQKYHAETGVDYGFIVQAALPGVPTTSEAAKNMLNRIYLIGPKTTDQITNVDKAVEESMGNPAHQNKYDEYILIDVTPAGSTTKKYQWENIGSTDIDLRGYLKQTNTKSSDSSITITYDTTENTFDFKHNNTITAGNNGAGALSKTFATSAADNHLIYTAIKVPYVTYDAQGHITNKSTQDATLTINLGRGINSESGVVGHENEYFTSETKIGDDAPDQTLAFGDSITVPAFAVDEYGHVKNEYTKDLTLPDLSAGTGITFGASPNKESLTINHSNSVTAETTGKGGEAGTNSSSAPKQLGASGSIVVPRIKWDTEGHLTGVSEFFYKLPADLTATDGVKIDNRVIKHTNKYFSAAATKGGAAAATTLTHTGTFKVPRITYDLYGHISAISETTYTLPGVPTAPTLSLELLASHSNSTYSSSDNLDNPSTYTGFKVMKSAVKADGTIETAEEVFQMKHITHGKDQVKAANGTITTAATEIEQICLDVFGI